jgi:hypothetical protein
VRIVRKQSKMRHNAESDVTAGGAYIYHLTENGEQPETRPHLNFNFYFVVRTVCVCLQGTVDW